MNRRQVYIQALRIVCDLCLATDYGLWDSEDESISDKDRDRIVRSIHAIGLKLDYRADKLEAKGKKVNKQ